MLNGNTFGESYRASHRSEDIVADYVKTFEVGYCAALWREVEQPLLESMAIRKGVPAAQGPGIIRREFSHRVAKAVNRKAHPDCVCCWHSPDQPGRSDEVRC